MWTMLLCYPLMTAVQLVSAHIGRVTGAGLASNLARTFPRQFVGLLIGILLIANIINIGADLSAMAAAAQLVVGGGEHAFVIGIAAVGTLLQLFVPYRRYASILKWLTLSLFAYVAVLLVVRVDWPAALRGLVWPSDLGHDAMVTIVALLGTTISPYLFFWQSSQEAEEMDTDRKRPIQSWSRAAPSRQFRRMRFDTLAGMAFSNLISLAIIMADRSHPPPQRRDPDRLRSRRRGGAAPGRRPVRLRPVRDRDRRHGLARGSGARRIGRLRGRRDFRLEGGPRISAKAGRGLLFDHRRRDLHRAFSSTGRRSTRCAPCSGARCSTASPRCR